MSGSTVAGPDNSVIHISWSNDDLANLAQSFGNAISNLPTNDVYYDPLAAVTTKALGIVITTPGANVTGTANNATVIGTGQNITYTANGNKQSILFSATGTGNLLQNGSGSPNETYYVDAGGTSPSDPGTTVKATHGAATINAYSGYLDVQAGSGGVLLHDQGGNVSITGGKATIGGAGSVTMAGGTFNIVPYSADALHSPTLPATVPSLTAVGTSDIIQSKIGIALNLADGSAVTLQGSGWSQMTDTVTALGGSVYASSTDVLINQTGAGNLSIGAGSGGSVTVSTAASATETITSSCTSVFVDVANGDTLSLTGGGNFSLDGTGSDTINLGASTDVNLAGGTYFVGAAGKKSSITFSGADTVSFASTALAASVLGATATTLKSGTGTIVDKTTASGKTLLITGTTGNSPSTYFIDPKNNNVLYFGTPAVTDWNGAPVESTDFTANNVIVSVSGGSQTVFGGGSSTGQGVLKAEYGGTSGKNFLVGAQSIFGGGGGDTLQAGAYTTYVQAASSGNSTLIGSDLAGAANETLVGNKSADTFIFGTGNETITASSVSGHGANRFVDINHLTSNTTITINDFVHGSNDKLVLASAGDSSTTATVTNITDFASYSVVTLSDGVTIKFAGTNNISSTNIVTNGGHLQTGTIG